MPFGFTDSQWVGGKEEITRLLQERAGQFRGQMYYSELCSKLQSIKLTPHEDAMGEILGEISTYEFRNGRGMLSAIVVHKGDDMEPGNGFYPCAKSLGLDISDKLKCWVDQLHKVHGYWSKQVQKQQ